MTRKAKRRAKRKPKAPRITAKMLGLKTIDHPGVIVTGVYILEKPPGYKRFTQDALWTPVAKEHFDKVNHLRDHAHRAFKAAGYPGGVNHPFLLGVIVVVPATKAGHMPGNEGDKDNVDKGFLDCMGWDGTNADPIMPLIPGDDYRYYQGGCNVGGIPPRAYLTDHGAPWEMHWQIETVEVLRWPYKPEVNQ